MTNVAYLYVNDFPGCILSISIAEMKSGPYIESISLSFAIIY